MFQVLDETPLQLIELGQDMKMLIWEYDGNYYLKINAVKLKEVHVENACKKDHPYIMGLTFWKYDFEKKGEQITGYSILKLTKHIKLLYVEMGLSESSFNIITNSLCKVSCDSPCCVKTCGEDNHCICHIDTHENVISDSDGEHIENNNNTCGTFRK